MLLQGELEAGAGNCYLEVDWDRRVRGCGLSFGNMGRDTGKRM